MHRMGHRRRMTPAQRAAAMKNLAKARMAKASRSGGRVRRTRRTTRSRRGGSGQTGMYRYMPAHERTVARRSHLASGAAHWLPTSRRTPTTHRACGVRRTRRVHRAGAARRLPTSRATPASHRACGMRRRTSRRGAGFLDDFIGGFKKGFSGVLRPAATIASLIPHPAAQTGAKVFDTLASLAGGRVRRHRTMRRGGAVTSRGVSSTSGLPVGYYTGGRTRKSGCGLSLGRGRKTGCGLSRGRGLSLPTGFHGRGLSRGGSRRHRRTTRRGRGPFGAILGQLLPF